MWGSAIFYLGVVLAIAGLGLIVKPVRRLGVPTRRRALALAAAGLLLAVVAFYWPASESRVARVESRLDEFTPVWQFHEAHTVRIAAPPSRVFDAIKQVRADEILLYRTLTWIRRGGRSVPTGVLNPGSTEPLLDVMFRAGFVRLAEDPPRELVIGAPVMVPPGTRGLLTPEIFRKSLPPGFAFATMNFLVTADGSGGSVVSTETRVFANSPAAIRRFAGYWRIIYPGSAIIRRMWLRAVERRAERPPV